VLGSVTREQRHAETMLSLTRRVAKVDAWNTLHGLVLLTEARHRVESVAPFEAFGGGPKAALASVPPPAGTTRRQHAAAQDWPFKCSACGSREVALWLFAKRAEAEGWIEG
jgi:hypothetical protein